MKNLNELAKEVHEGNVARGFYEVQPTLKTQLVLVITELSEAVQADRKWRYFSSEKYNHEKRFGDLFESDLFIRYIKGTFEDEIADAFIRLLDIAGNHEVNIESVHSGHFVNNNKIDDIFVMTYKICLISRYEDHFSRLLNESICSIIDYCSLYGIDLDFHVTEKLRYNATREYKHGKKY